MHNNYLPTTDASSEQRHGHAGLMAALRNLNETAILLNTNSAALQQLTTQVEELAQEFQSRQGKRLLEYYNGQLGLQESNGMQPYSPVGGLHHPTAAPLTFRVEADKVLAEATYGMTHEGPPQSVHGGITAGVFDYVLAAACTLQDRGGPTLYLNTRYIKPVPLFTPIQFSAWIERTEGRKSFVRGECRAGDTLLAEADALFLHTPVD